ISSLLLAAGDGFLPLFNGHSLAGWTLVGGKGPGYVVQEGHIVCPADGGGNLFTTAEYADFLLRLEFRMSPGANNGVGIRAPLTGRTSRQGIEIQLRDDSAPEYRERQQPVKKTGSVYDVIPAATGALKPAGIWNAMEITAKGRHIQVALNGTQILNADLDSVTDTGILRLHPGLARTSGHIGFLGHGTRIEFRNIRIHPLP
ncbi:MAG: 3-keto-disaccharide hydrolase, partial [Bryobacteraceae bacterium]